MLRNLTDKNYSFSNLPQLISTSKISNKNRIKVASLPRGPGQKNDPKSLDWVGGHISNLYF